MSDILYLLTRTDDDAMDAMAAGDLLEIATDPSKLRPLVFRTFAAASRLAYTDALLENQERTGEPCGIEPAAIWLDEAEAPRTVAWYCRAIGVSYHITELKLGEI